MEKEQREIEALKPDKTDETVSLPFVPILSIETAAEDYYDDRGRLAARVDSSVISFKQQWFEYGNERTYLGVNFDMASGKRLFLTDLLVEEEDFQKEAIEIIWNKLQDSLDENILDE